MTVSNIEARINTEIEKLKNKSYNVSSWISTIFIGIYGFFINVLFIIAEINFLEIVVYLLLFGVIVGLNIWALSQKKDFKALRWFSITSILFMYAFVIYLLFNNNLPGIYANIFLAFTIGYIFLDEYTTILNHFMMAIISSIFVWVFPEIFGFTGDNIYSLLMINSILFVLIFLLFFSSLFNIRKKNYNYKQLALSKENEYRIINIVFEMTEKYFKNNEDYNEYFESIKNFFDIFSKKNNVVNIFNKRIDFIEELEKMVDINEMQTDIPLEYIKSLDLITVKKRKRMRYIAFKLSQSFELEDNKRVPGIDLFSSLRHYDDREEVKIIAFSAFYVYFRMNKIEKKAIDDEHFITLLKNSDIENLIEPKNLDIYYKHKDVFDKIVQHSLNKEVN
jgi:hypothetical protein